MWCRGYLIILSNWEHSSWFIMHIGFSSLFILIVPQLFGHLPCNNKLCLKKLPVVGFLFYHFIVQFYLQNWLCFRWWDMTINGHKLNRKQIIESRRKNNDKSRDGTWTPKHEHKLDPTWTWLGADVSWLCMGLTLNLFVILGLGLGPRRRTALEPSLNTAVVLIFNVNMLHCNLQSFLQ